jgi:hypothetical protein
MLRLSSRLEELKAGTWNGLEEIDDIDVYDSGRLIQLLGISYHITQLNSTHY